MERKKIIMVCDDDRTRTTQWEVQDVTTIYTLANPICDNGLIMSIIIDNEIAQMRNGWITHKPKHLNTKSYSSRIDTNARNRLHCKRKVKQSIRGLEMSR